MYPRQTQHSRIQYRLQNQQDFPYLDKSDTPLSQISNEYPTSSSSRISILKTQSVSSTTSVKEPPSEYITKNQLEQIVNNLKIEIIKQLNITKLISKIKEIQETVKQNIQKDNKNNPDTNNSILLVINKQLEELIHPEILQPQKSPTTKNESSQNV